MERTGQSAPLSGAARSPVCLLRESNVETRFGQCSSVLIASTWLQEERTALSTSGKFGRSQRTSGRRRRTVASLRISPFAHSRATPWSSDKRVMGSRTSWTSRGRRTDSFSPPRSIARFACGTWTTRAVSASFSTSHSARALSPVETW